jgi:hypothetical protein
MSRTIAIAVLAGVLATAAIAAPQRQLVGPNFNPGLRTVPFVQTSQSAETAGLCEKKLVTRIDSGTIITGPDSQVAHVTGMAGGVAGADGELVVTSTSNDGAVVAVDFVACAVANAFTPAPVATSLPLNGQPNLKVLNVRAQSNAITLNTGR